MKSLRFIQKIWKTLETFWSPQQSMDLHIYLRNIVRLFWIFVTASGFAASGYMIYQSFEAWHESPVKTTIETRPITEITFPKVTVCPPKNTFTDLNHDLIMTENMTLDNETRDDLSNYARELIYDDLFGNMIKNLSILKDNDRYLKWYYGNTEIKMPFWSDHKGLNYLIDTYATSGTISTQHYGEKFDAEKIAEKSYYSVWIHPPDSIKSNSNVTLHLDIEKISMTDLLTGQDEFALAERTLDDVETKISKLYTPPAESVFEEGKFRLVNIYQTKFYENIIRAINSRIFH